LVPHEDTSAVTPPLPLVPVLPALVPVLVPVLAGALDVAAALEVDAPPPAALLELLLLLPHPASASSATAATNASPIRIRGMR